MCKPYVVQPEISTSTRRELALIALCDVCNRPSPQADIDAAVAELDAAREADEAFKAAKKAARNPPGYVHHKPSLDCLTEGLEVALAHARGLGAVETAEALENAWRALQSEKAVVR